MSRRLFPKCNPSNNPQHIKCWDCSGPGWGPMLTSELWFRIVDHLPFVASFGFFLCQPCMEKRIGRPLAKGDLRDCPMNHGHPMYVRNNQM